MGKSRYQWSPHGAGARVAQLELKGERLHFRLLEGQGPQTGWASLKLKAVMPGIEGMEILGDAGCKDDMVLSRKILKD